MPPAAIQNRHSDAGSISRHAEVHNPQASRHVLGRVRPTSSPDLFYKQAQYCWHTSRACQGEPESPRQYACAYRASTQQQ